MSDRWFAKSFHGCAKFTLLIVAQWLNPWLKRPKTLKLFFLKFSIFIMYFVFQLCGMTYQSIFEGHFKVLGPQIHTFSGIVRNSYLIQSVY